MERRNFVRTLLFGCAGLYILTKTEEISGMYTVTRNENGIETVYKNGKYQFCTEYQRLYDTYWTKPPMDEAIVWDKAIRFMIVIGYWDRLEHIYHYNTENEHDALLNWKDPNNLNN